MAEWLLVWRAENCYVQFVFFTYRLESTFNWATLAWPKWWSSLHVMSVSIKLIMICRVLSLLVHGMMYLKEGWVYLSKNVHSFYDKGTNADYRGLPMQNGAFIVRHIRYIVHDKVQVGPVVGISVSIENVLVVLTLPDFEPK